jgi:hypothetical protein
MHLYRIFRRTPPYLGGETVKFLLAENEGAALDAHARSLGHADWDAACVADASLARAEVRQAPVPDFRLARCDETYAWGDPGLVHRAGGRIWTIGYFDANRYVHICSFTPNYEFWYYETEADDYPVANAWRRRAERFPEGSAERERCEDRAEREYEAVSDEIRDEGNRANEICDYIGTDVEGEPIWPLTEAEWLALIEEHDGDDQKAYEALVEAIREGLNTGGIGTPQSWWTPAGPSPSLAERETA